MSSEKMNLANLQSDIIRNVIVSGLESIDNMRVISHRWHTLLKDRKMLPPIERFFLCHFSDGCFVAMVSIAPRYATYFGVSKWNYKSTAGLNQEFSKLFDVAEEYTELNKYLSKLFARSSRVNLFKFVNLEVDYLLLIKPILRDIHIRELEIGSLNEFSENEEFFLTKFIRENSVQKLVLNFIRPAAKKWSDSKPGLAKFLPLVARDLSSIDLVYCWSELERNARSDKIIRDMWKEKVNELAEETGLTINWDACYNALRINIEK
ncbi:hypothetical protein PRIPAC_73914 [Pristionchus pacificus]|uniref:Uncharacterized protein n=1 Tax=Pristionchus pacificus TaxID=54126 RepID=A0A2A6BZH8_PRIPA|nr:hypothetical protein PRIPAC_73914 [Pristionchus pacificus]|eukprot:PDM71325.1 hypothetical protein PRIPAC_37732 [Pristionchus pacificus]